MSPVHVEGKVLGVKRVGTYVHLTLVAPGLPEQFRPGSFLSLTVGGPMSDRLLRRAFLIYRVRASGAYGGTVEVVFAVTGVGTDWLSQLGPGAPLDVVGPLGRPFALPKEPVTCTLVGHGAGIAPLLTLAQRLHQRQCVVHVVLMAATESKLFGALEAKRTAKTVVVGTADGSIGLRGDVADMLPGQLPRTGTEVVYACGPPEMLHQAARAAQEHGAWSQTAVQVAMPCATGACLACVVPVVGEDGVARAARACVEGPVFRGDRVRWGALEPSAREAG